MISEIVPIYNIEDYLPRSIDSILSQTYSDLEIILVDDGSTDSSREICDNYSTKDSRIKVIHKNNGGISSARNCGLNVASGEYILMADGDDVLNSYMIKILYDLIISGDYDFAMCYSRVCFDVDVLTSKSLEPGHTLGVIEINQDLCIKNLFDENLLYVTVWNKLYKRISMQDFYFTDTSSEDLEFNTRYFLKMKKAILTDRELYYWIQRSSSITHLAVNQRFVNIHNSWKLCLDALPMHNLQYRSYCFKKNV